MNYTKISLDRIFLSNYPIIHYFNLTPEPSAKGCLDRNAKMLWNPRGRNDSMYYRVGEQEFFRASSNLQGMGSQGKNCLAKTLRYVLFQLLISV